MSSRGGGGVGSIKKSRGYWIFHPGVYINSAFLRSGGLYSLLWLIGTALTMGCFKLIRVITLNGSMSSEDASINRFRNFLDSVQGKKWLFLPTDES